MIIKTEIIGVNDFEFWSGAIDTVKYLTDEECEIIFQFLEKYYPNGMTDEEFNNFFWFQDEIIAELLGYECFEDIMKRKGA